jgi:hypothetical protein
MVALVACSCSGGSPKGSPPMTSTSSPPPSTLPNEVAPEPAVDLRKVPWTRTEPTAHGLRVYATLTGGAPCAVLGRVDVKETAHAVTVTLWVGKRPGADCSGPQTGVGFPIVTTVDLKAPLGKRAVHDGARP